MIGRAAGLIAGLALAGCAGEQRPSPSLSHRALEDRGWAEQAPPAAGPVVADPALENDLATRRDALAASDRAFTAAARRAEPLVRAARSDAVGGERWIAAQSALATLDGQRATTLEAVSAVEALALARAASLQPDYPPLAQLQAAAEAQLASETKRIAELQEALPQG